MPKQIYTEERLYEMDQAVRKAGCYKLKALKSVRKMAIVQKPLNYGDTNLIYTFVPFNDLEFARELVTKMNANSNMEFGIKWFEVKADSEYL
jgi:hypothetical protein